MGFFGRLEWLPVSLVLCDGRYSNHFQMDSGLAAPFNLVWIDLTLLQWNRELATRSTSHITFGRSSIGHANSHMVSPAQ